MKKEDKEQKEEKKVSFKGKVITPFKVKGKVYEVGDKYDAKDKKSFDYLKSTNKIN